MDVDVDADADDDYFGWVDCDGVANVEGHDFGIVAGWSWDSDEGEG